MIQEYRASREALLARIVQTLSEDERFIAAWLAGSLGRGDADAVSDLDLNLVVSDMYSTELCRRAAQVSHETTPERLELFSQFGKPAAIHENNNNAPNGGTFTFVLYTGSALMVDWILVPQENATRPNQTLLLFDRSGTPVEPPAGPESLEVRIERASEIMAFFWMMMAVTAKYLVRGDQVFVTHWIEELTGMLREVERLVKGQAIEHRRGSISKFEPTPDGQRQALHHLAEWMDALLPGLIALGGEVLPSPMAEIELLLDFTHS